MQAKSGGVLGTHQRPFVTVALEMFFYWIPADEEVRSLCNVLFLLLF
jgi:hypothetical protein